MKRITIYQTNSMPLTIDDNDNSTLENFSRKLSKLLESSNVSILHTSTGSIVIRPDKISSIYISEIVDDSMEMKIRQQPVEEETKKIEENEDIITD